MSASSGKFSAATPLTLSTCRLVAETNVFGRIVNGVFPARVCDQREESEVFIFSSTKINLLF